MTAQPSEDGDNSPVLVTTFPPSMRVAIFGTFLILFLGALYYARGFVLPLVLACLLTLTLSPLVRKLTRWGVPAALSAVLLMVAFGGGIGAASMLLSGPVSQVTADMPKTISKARERLSFLRRPIAAIDSAGQDIESALNGAADGAPTRTVVVSGGGLVRWLVGTLADFGTTVAATLVLAGFLMAAVESLRYKMVTVLPQFSERKRSLRVLHEIENDVSRYLVTVSAINACLGVLVGSTMAAFGIGNGIVWGVAAALLNFIPYAGATIGIAAAAATSLATFDALTTAAMPPLIYLVIQVIEGTFVTPMILGRRLSLSPIAILTTLSLTTWMWGIVGTIIGVPLLVVFKVFCDQFESLAGIGVFLSGEPAVVVDPEEKNTPAVVAVVRNQSPVPGVESIEAGE